MTFSKVDLHIHTTASDGTFSPEQVVKLALELEMQTIAISDHDSTDGIYRALQAARGTSLEVIPGIELSCDVTLGEVHILGYFIKRSNKNLIYYLKKLRSARLERARGMLKKLSEMGMPIKWSNLTKLTQGKSAGRMHIAQLMFESGYIENTREAFEKYIGRNGPAYVERFRLSPTEAVKLIKTAGGLAVLAHPIIAAAMNRGNQLDPEIILPDLVKAGLAGLETFYPNYDQEITSYLLKWLKNGI